jgi:hypothetical protein
MTISRDFKGIWTPREIWLDRTLTYFEKALLSEIHSLDGQEGCFASNEYLCEFFNEKERKIQDGLAKLKAKGYVYQVSFDGRTRVLKTSLNPNIDKSLFSTSEVLESAPLPPPKSTPLSYIYNKENNKDYKQQQQAAAVAEKKYEVREDDIQYENSKGDKLSISQSEVFKHFIKLPYSTDIIKKAISSMKSTTKIVNNPLKLLESICKTMNENSKLDIKPADKKETKKTPVKEANHITWAEFEKQQKLKEENKNVSKL